MNETSVAIIGGGLAGLATAGANRAALPFLYFVPLAGIMFGIAAFAGNAHMRIPYFVERMFDRFISAFERILAGLGIHLRGSAQDT